MKVEYSQISPLSLREVLFNKYNFPVETEVIFLNQGFNDTYKVLTPNKKYILRVYRYNWKSYNDILGEIEFINFLHTHNITVSFPIPNQENEYINKLNYPEGLRYFILFSYASGKNIPVLSLNSAKLFGEQLAQLHRVSEKFKIEKLSKYYSPSTILEFAKSSLKVRLELSSLCFDLLAKIESILTAKLNLKILKKLQQGICHGDPHYENCFINKDKRTLTFFDFDFCGNGYFLYDIGSFCHYERNNPEIIKSFLNGYKNIKSLSEIELSSIPYFETLMKVFHLGARAKNADGIKNPIWLTTEIESRTLEIYNQLNQFDKKYE